MKSLPVEFNDKRGSINVIAHNHSGSVAVIESVAEVERANHYHKDDYHYCYVVYGTIIYYEREVGASSELSRRVYSKGEIFYTPPMVEHCMFFPEPTAFVTLGGKTRSQDEYEADLVRVASLHQEYLENSAHAD